MHKLFLSSVKLGPFIVNGPDVEHLHAVRVKIGDVISVSDGSFSGEAVVTEIRKDSVHLDVTEIAAAENEPSVCVNVFCANLKGQSNEFVLKKCVEIGAGSINFFQSDNCVAQVTERIDKKISRLNELSRQAAMQCGRDTVPPVRFFESFDSAVEDASKSEVSLFLHEKSDVPFIRNLGTPLKTASFMVGPEGGFSLRESQFALSKGIVPVTLGKLILRAETAPIYALSVMNSVYESGLEF